MSASATKAPVRSWLFAPANHARRVEKALASSAHAVILDLEDAVALAEKAEARASATAALAVSRPNRYVRINAMSTPFALADVAAIVPGRPDGLMLAKPEGAKDVAVLDWLLTQHEREHGLPLGSTRILPLIETAEGLTAAAAIASASPRVEQLAFGAGDFTLDLGLNWSRDEHELLPFRLALALASRAARLEAPVDLAWVRVSDAEGMAASAARARDHGFAGKLCIHPDQVAAVNAAYQPSADEVARAREVVAAFEVAEAAGSAAIQVGGKLIDYPIVAAARRTLADAAREAG